MAIMKELVDTDSIGVAREAMLKAAERVVIYMDLISQAER